MVTVIVLLKYIDMGYMGTFIIRIGNSLVSLLKGDYSFSSQVGASVFLSGIRRSHIQSVVGTRKYRLYGLRLRGQTVTIWLFCQS